MLAIERFRWTEFELRHKTDGSRRDAARARDRPPLSAPTAELSASLRLIGASCRRVAAEIEAPSIQSSGIENAHHFGLVADLRRHRPAGKVELCSADVPTQTAADLFLSFGRANCFWWKPSGGQSPDNQSRPHLCGHVNIRGRWSTTGCATSARNSGLWPMTMRVALR